MWGDESECCDCGFTLDECSCGDACYDCGLDLDKCSCDDSYTDTEYYDGIRFADPGGASALRAASSTNPRTKPCPTCGGKNLLTPQDVDAGYQCNSCADKAEGGC